MIGNRYFGADWYKGPSQYARPADLKVMATNTLRQGAAASRRTARLYDEELHRRGLSDNDDQ